MEAQTRSAGRVRRAAFGLALTLLVAACGRSEAPAPPLFELLPPSATGVAFVNALPESSELNILSYLYYYNGGGVAVGDVDGDGLADLYLSSNLASSRLYLNRGDFRFEDVTDRAGVAGPAGWKSGVTMADVDGDGDLDIYVSGVNLPTMAGHNVLYVNDGTGSFTDRTKEYGLEHRGYSTQAAFFDYDGDGDLDMYLLTHATHADRSSGTAVRRGAGAPAADRLFRNDPGPGGARRFVDVTAAAGIADPGGFGLGVVTSDLDGDGCPDIYVANDFQENDLLYVNNCDGTFTESITKVTGHTSRFSMGVDAADFDNDGRTDVFVADMLPEREDILKTSSSTESFTLFNLRLEAGYQPQYARNTLQLNRGLWKFSDVGFLAGVAASDWSWAPLFADLDNDGSKDLFVTNGVYRRPNDLDYIDYVGNEAVQASLANGDTAQARALIRRMPQVPLPNHAFRNNGDLTFTNVGEAWGLAREDFSNGAAYADLDNDGALDLVVNRINAPAAIYRNRSRERNGNAFLTLVLRGDGLNTAGVGAKALVRQDGRTQTAELLPTRGFQSSVDPRLHVGLGRDSVVDSLTVVWPDRRFQVLTGVRANRTLELHQRDAQGSYEEAPPVPAGAWFEDVTRELHAGVPHVEGEFRDYGREPLMPRLLSTEGPALAVGDVDGDGLDDIYVGGAKWQAGRVLLQQRDGVFRQSGQRAFQLDSLAEDVDAAFFDADGDGDEDLYVVSGGNEFWDDAEPLRDRLYVNNGRGGFQRAADALPRFFHNGGCVAPADFDGDGDMDLFVGSRVVARAYGAIPKSFLLENDGRGRFRDVTAERAPSLSEAGMVAAAAWLDYDGDRQLDLVVTGEWMPVRVFRQLQGHFVDQTSAAGLEGTEGWWSSATAADLNADGRQDVVLGNLGLNAYVRATAAEPARLYVYDFGQTGSLKQVLTFYKGGVSYPIAGRDELVRLIPSLRARYPGYADFGASRAEEIFGNELRKATVREARTFASAVAINTGAGGFRLQPLPAEAQLAPIHASLVEDFDADGKQDLLVAGNFHGVPPVFGRYDASYGLLLRGDGSGAFIPVEMSRSKLLIEGEVRRLRGLDRVPTGSGGAAERLVIVARNNDTLQIVRVRR
jgi:hypothetical protein